MKQPPGYHNLAYPGYVCKLDKAIYGLKQSPRSWYSRFSTKLLQLGFHASKADTSLFIYRKGRVQMYLLVYVNDIIVVGSSDQAVHALLSDLRVDFGLKDIGTLSYFLGIEVKKCVDGIVLTQAKYMMDILKRVGMTGCKPTCTPLTADEKLSLDDGDQLSQEDAMAYHGVVVALQFLTLTRSDVSFSVNKVCQFLHAPTQVH
jgi:hypothetical protein